MKNIKYFIIAFITLVASVSCNSFLDVNPDGEKIESSLYDSPQGFEDAIYGAYSALSADVLYGKYLSFYISDIMAGYYTASSSPGYAFGICNLTTSTSLTVIDNIWSKFYTTISYANNVLDNLDESEEAKSYVLYNVYRAEALALRAFCHFEVSRWFCQNILNNPDADGIPYKEHYDFTVAGIDKLSVTYEKIIADLKEAEELYDGEDYWGINADTNAFLADRKIHMNLHAIRGILARVYWTMGDLENAAKYATLAVENNRVNLISDYDELKEMTGGIVGRKEALLGIFYDDFFLNTYNSFFDEPLVSETYNTPYLVLDFENKIVDIYSADKDDTMIEYRYEKWFYEPTNWNNESGTRFMKLVDSYHMDIETATSSRSFTAIDGVNLLRLPELYYIITEYYVSIGDQTNAKLYFDKVITTRGLTSYETRGTDITVDIINNERRKEYIGEGQYIFVMKKYNLPYYNNSTGETLEASDDYYVFTMPDSELEYRD